MALSNWDTLAFGPDGKPCDGTLKGFDGQTASIYKNWLYVGDPKMWHKDRGYVKPIIAKVSSGDIRLADFTISAVRGPQDAIFVCVECRHYLNPKDYSKVNIRRMVGIGCYGFDDPTERMAADLNISLKGKDYVHRSGMEAGGEKHTFLDVLNAKNAPPTRYKLPYNERYNSQWVGVLPSTLENFKRWLRKVDTAPDFVAWLKTLGIAKRFNQGDAYFVKKIGGVALETSTPIGKNDKPVLQKVLDENH